MSESMAINSTGTNNNSTNQALGPNNGIDKNAFLKILMIQLQNQDPMNPIQDKEFIAQMAQFSSLEQLQELNKQFSVNQEILFAIHDSIEKQNSTYLEKLDELNTNLDKSINKDVEVINQLVNINKAISSYNPE